MDRQPMGASESPRRSGRATGSPPRAIAPEPQSPPPPRATWAGRCGKKLSRSDRAGPACGKGMSTPLETPFWFDTIAPRHAT